MCACSQGQLSLILRLTRVYHVTVFNSLQTCIKRLFSTCVFSLAALLRGVKIKREIRSYGEPQNKNRFTCVDMAELKWS